MAFDEGRFGLKVWFRRRWCTFGHRPPWIVDDRYEWVWVYIAVTPQSGECCCLLLPHVDTDCLNLFLATVREKWPDERIGVVLDGSGSHRSDNVIWPQGIVPLPLPPYSPELDPAEQFFRHLRQRLANRIFATIEEMKDTLTAELQRLWDHPKGRDTDDELSVVARRSQRHHAIFIVKEYSGSLLSAGIAVNRVSLP